MVVKKKKAQICPLSYPKLINTTSSKVIIQPGMVSYTEMLL